MKFIGGISKNGSITGIARAVCLITSSRNGPIVAVTSFLLQGI